MSEDPAFHVPPLGYNPLNDDADETNGMAHAEDMNGDVEDGVR
jgi:hypothetical protein